MAVTTSTGVIAGAIALATALIGVISKIFLDKADINRRLEEMKADIRRLEDMHEEYTRDRQEVAVIREQMKADLHYLREEIIRHMHEENTNLKELKDLIRRHVR